MEDVDNAIATAITTYHEINAQIVDELFEEPSPLEFMRFVSRNRPFVVRGAAADWEAVKKWDAEYLGAVMGGEDVQVAITPYGNADSIIETERGELLFVQPHEVQEEFTSFLDYIRHDSQQPAPSPKQPRRHVKYAQTQNNNLYGEYSTLIPDVPAEIPFARVALEKSADAVNVWIGNQRSTTALHKDNYENLYVQVRGRKNFVLMPPVEGPCVRERGLRRGRYVPSHSPADAGAEGVGGCEDANVGELSVEIDKDAEQVPVPTWDPDTPHERTTRFSHLASPLRVELREGDMLYLPAMWYHKVSQMVGEEDFASAVNYWYDMEFAGSAWTSATFMRDVVAAVGQEKERGGAQ